MRYLLLTGFLFFAFGCGMLTKVPSPVDAQSVSTGTNLDNMNEAERNEWLTLKTKEIVLQYMPSYYRDVPVLIKRVSATIDTAVITQYYVVIPHEKQKGWQTYTATSEGETYTFDMFNAMVVFDASDGRVVTVRNADGYGIGFLKQKQSP